MSPFITILSLIRISATFNRRTAIQTCQHLWNPLFCETDTSETYPWDLLLLAKLCVPSLIFHTGTRWHTLCIELKGQNFSTAVGREWRHISDGEMCLDVGEHFCYWSVAYSQKFSYMTEIPFCAAKFVGRILEGSWSNSREFFFVSSWLPVKRSFYKDADFYTDAGLSPFTFCHSLEELVSVMMEALE